MRWKVHKADGGYVGECEGIAPEVAFCECMVGSGKTIDACNITAVAMLDGSYQISFEGLVYVLKPEQPGFHQGFRGPS
jgi:hypothetical protein